MDQGLNAHFLLLMLVCQSLAVCGTQRHRHEKVHILILKNAPKKILLLFCMFVVLKIQGSPVL